ncbi:hypothetical protein [Gordonia sp. CPCC 205333]|uniref:hypothetical protein n=1 Tax=Gordonia sp. CPCC 205333 TaxID=3140790 RepID=UPI003AF3A2E2
MGRRIQRSDGDLYQRCRQQLIDAGIWRCRSVDEICARVGELIGRQVVLSPMPLRHRSLHGLLVRTESVDYIVYESETSQFHRDHIALHELSHQICGHRGQIVPGDRVRVLGRISDHDAGTDADEQEAEVMASLLGMFISGSARTGPVVVEPDQKLTQVMRSFGLLDS